MSSTSNLKELIEKAKLDAQKIREFLSAYKESENSKDVNPKDCNDTLNALKTQLTALNNELNEKQSKTKGGKRRKSQRRKSHRKKKSDRKKSKKRR